MTVQTYIWKKCPDCDGHGYVKVEDEHGRELGTSKCPNPLCKNWPRIGSILVKKEQEK